MYKQSDDNSRRVYALRGSLRDIPTLWNFSGCFIKTQMNSMLFNWAENYNLLNNIPLLFPKTELLFLGVFLECSFSLSLHKCTVDQGMISRVATLPEILSYKNGVNWKKIVVLVSQVKLHLSTLLDGCIRNNDYNSVRHKVQSEKFYRSALNLGAVQEKFWDFQWWNNLIGTLMPPTFLH